MNFNCHAGGSASTKAAEDGGTGPNMWLFAHKLERKSVFNLCGHQKETFGESSPKFEAQRATTKTKSKPVNFKYFKSEMSSHLVKAKHPSSLQPHSAQYTQTFAFEAQASSRGSFSGRIQFQNGFLVLPQGFIKRPQARIPTTAHSSYPHVQNQSHRTTSLICGGHPCFYSWTKRGVTMAAVPMKADVKRGVRTWFCIINPYFLKVLPRPNYTNPMWRWRRRNAAV